MKIYLLTASLLLASKCFGATVVPIEIVNGNPVATAQINDVTVKLVIDSGGGVVTLKTEAIKRVAAARTGATRPTTDALGNNASRNLFHLGTLEMGTFKVVDIDADESTEHASQSPVDGMIGRFVLNRYAVVYDYAAHKVTFIDPARSSELRTECRGTPIDLMPAPEGILVSGAKIDQADIRMLWDSGAVYSFIKQSFADRNKLPIETPYYTTQTLRFSDVNLGALRFVVLDLRAPEEADAYIGSNFFLAHIVCIDPTHRVVKVLKSS